MLQERCNIERQKTAHRRACVFPASFSDASEGKANVCVLCSFDCALINRQVAVAFHFFFSVVATAGRGPADLYWQFDPPRPVRSKRFRDLDHSLSHSQLLRPYGRSLDGNLRRNTARNYSTSSRHRRPLGPELSPTLAKIEKQTPNSAHSGLRLPPLSAFAANRSQRHQKQKKQRPERGLSGHPPSFPGGVISGSAAAGSVL